jgi:homoserine dehydrogenase
MVKSRHKVAILGFGTVGSAVARLLQTEFHAGLDLAWICNRDVERKRVDSVGPDVRWTDSFDDVLDSDVDIVAELIGGMSPAEEWIRRALEAGKSVVTANKRLIAECGSELVALARQRGCYLAFEAAVAGGIPVVHGIKDGLAGDRLVRIVGILNGTCNYILTRMEQDGLGFAEALAEAQNAGLAEADPSRDLDGLDARDKIAILSWLGLSRRVQPADVACHSIAPISAIDFNYARRLGCTIRQLSFVAVDESSSGSVFAWVRPALVSVDSPLARVSGSQNVVVTTGKFGGETGFYGYGAGGDPTAVAILSDLIGIAGATKRSGRVDGAGVPRCAVTPEFAAPYYLRFVVVDRPGILAGIATILEQFAINIDAVLQERSRSKSQLPFVITLERCEASALSGALRRIRELNFHREPLLCMPMLVDQA